MADLDRARQALLRGLQGWERVGGPGTMGPSAIPPVEFVLRHAARTALAWGYSIWCKVLP